MSEDTVGTVRHLPVFTSHQSSPLKCSLSQLVRSFDDQAAPWPYFLKANIDDSSIVGEDYRYICMCFLCSLDVDGDS